MSFTTIGHNMPDLSVEIDVTNDPTNPTRVWTDVTSKVRQLTYTRSGRDTELQQTTTGRLTVVFDDRADGFTTLGLRKTQWIRVRAQWATVTYARWQGIVTTQSRAWTHAGKDATVTVIAADVLKIFNLYDMADQTFASQRNDQRVAAIAALVGLTTGSIDTDTDTADAVPAITQGTDALSMLLEIEQSENGLLLADPGGTLSFQGRHWRMLNSASSVATLGETSVQIPYRDDVEYDDDDTYLANIAAVTPAGGGALQTASDATSMTRYFSRRINRTLLTSSVTVASDAASYLVHRYADPTARIPSVKIQLQAVARRSSTLAATLLAVNNSTRLTWTRAATSAISTDVYVEQISETIIPGSDWQMTLQLSPAADESGWVLGDATLGVLGTSTRLVY